MTPYSVLQTLSQTHPTYPIIPICHELLADTLTPIALLRRLAAESRYSFLLESVEGGEKWGRYSFLGCDPILRAACRNGTVTLTPLGSSAKPRTMTTANPLDTIRSILERYRAPSLPDLPPFAGGFVGYFAYPMFAYAEPSIRISRDEANDFDLMLFDTIAAYDHLKQTITLVSNVRTDELEQNYRKACGKIEALVGLITAASPLPVFPAEGAPSFTCNVTMEEYGRMVENTKACIRAGDIFQAVISRQFSSPYEGSLINAYRVLRTTNPSPYMVYLHIDGDEIISTSPETLVRLHNGRLATFPVAGSRPRGASPEEDERLERELLADEKELSEHNMLVDLGRNDLGRIARFGTVEVTGYQMIHKYSKIMHICSQVEADIRPDADACSAIEAVLPAGTLSGAPKIRACEIIEEQEKTPRGIYGGALGYLDFTGNLDTCIAIRMAVKQNGIVRVQAGGGIVADSVPEKEYEESENKAKAVIQAILRAEEVKD